MLKSIYLHPRYKKCSQELEFPHLENYVPLTINNIIKNFKIINDIDQADYIFLGQVCEFQKLPEDFKEICDHYKTKVIVDIEGDFGSELFPEYLTQTTVCAGGPDNKWNIKRCFVRPQLSKVLLELHKNYFNITPPGSKQINFFFQGQINVINRVLMIESLQEAKIPNTVLHLQNSWGGNKSIKDSTYCHTMDTNLLSLCPKGVGGSSIRFYESCFFGCVPIVLGTDLLMGHDYYDTSFVLRLEDYNDKNQLKNFFLKINSLSKEELFQRGFEARRYYDNIVNPHLTDPMGTFFRWLNHGV